MKIYKPKEYGIIKKKGVGHIILIDARDHAFAKEIKHGDIIRIEEENWEVIGIEVFWKLMYPPIKGDNYGFIVKYLGDQSSIG
jgi:hypothetical protein